MLKRLQLLWSDNKWYVVFGGFLMAAGIAFGFVQADLVGSMVKKMLAQVEQLAKTIQHSKNSTVTAFWVILFNNVFSSVSMMVLGLLFAFFPIYGLWTNGVLLGFMLKKAAVAGIHPVQLFLAGILPHGLFELPAVVFAASIGIRYGVLVLRSLGMVWRSDGRERVKQDWSRCLKQFPLAVLTVVGLLVIAAFVESVITPILLQKTISSHLPLIQMK